jgi:hypothetical protein
MSQASDQPHDCKLVNSGYDLVLYTGSGFRITNGPLWNKPGAKPADAQEVALPRDVGGALFGPGDLIPERLDLDLIGAYRRWLSLQPMSISRRSLRRARRSAVVQVFGYSNMRVLQSRSPGAAPAELVAAARQLDVPAVLFAEDGRDVLALVNFRLARDARAVMGEAESAVPGWLGRRRWRDRALAG